MNELRKEVNSIYMKTFLKRAGVAALTAAPVAAMAQSSSSDPLSAASTQISTWTPIISTLLVAAFGIAVLFKALRLGKKGVNAA
jgi:hypothetical protein